MRGITRVVIFCSLTTILPTILLILPLYLRHNLYAEVVYTVAESDTMEINDGVSTIFCSEHNLKMDIPFNAFKVSQRPEVTSSRKHIRLKKSMTLPDDTLEYWGFYLLKGATVALSVCSRFQGASILVVKGERSLRTCGMMDHNENKKKLKDNLTPNFQHQVEVTFQSNAKEIINSKELKQAGEIGESNIFDDPLIPKLDNSRINNDNNIVDKNVSEFVKNPSEEEINLLRKTAMNHIQKHVTVKSNRTRKGIDRLRHMKKRLKQMNNQRDNVKNDTEKLKFGNSENELVTESKFEPRNIVEEKLRSPEHERKVRELETELNSDAEIIEDYKENEKANYRYKRNQNGIKPPLLLDRGVEHGGNAINFTNNNNLNEDSSMSSFENGLLTCYDGHVLLAQQFEPSELCTNISFLVNSKRIQTEHNIIESGYYYYIFYSDNDYFSNDMHAVFDIYKPTFQYENLTHSCINKTECLFSLDFLSSDRIIVEVPTKDGIDDNEDNFNLLTSTCYPRMGIYTIFPIAVLLLVLGCAFV